MGVGAAPAALGALVETDPVCLVSACLVGTPTTYDGGHRLVPALVTLAARGLAVPICPEVAGGLGIPRPPAEIVGGSGEEVLDGLARVLTIDGEDVTDAFLAGAEAAAAVARRCGATVAILKARSPSCGSWWIYDGTHSGRLIRGQGVAAALLRRAGLTVLSEEEYR